MKSLRLFIARIVRGQTPKAPPSARETEYRAIVAAGNEARGQGRWDIAIDRYAAALIYEPDNAAVRVQLGHGLKELGRLSEAEASYRAASAIQPDDADILVQLGHVLKMQGRSEQALDAYAEALRRDPGSEHARTELIAAGGRSRLPDTLYGRSATTDALTRLSEAMRAQHRALQEVASVSTYPVEAYDAFRHAFPLEAPVGSLTTSAPMVVLIDATDAHPGEVRLSLASLLDQRCANWKVVVRHAGAMAEQPVASLSEQDDRIVFAQASAGGFDWSDDACLLLFDAGLALDPEAIGWFQMAQQRTGVDFVYADNDHHTHHWRRGRTYSDPEFQWMADPWDFTQAPAPPAAVLVAPSRRDTATATVTIAESAGADLRRRLLVEGLAAGARAAHIPRLLSSRRVSALNGPVETRPAEAPPFIPSRDDRLIRVIIPTRDEPQILKACVDSLLEKAAGRDRILLEIMDNRSEAPETAELLASWESDPNIQVKRFDEPFNWARMNNLAVADGSDGSILVFANNDVEMLTQDWDERLRDILADPDVGLVGTRLLYPDRTVQHAGVVLGVNDSRPVHEGLGQSEQAVGPNSRWVRRRQVAAVTGAFMALDQTVFERLGGFDERLAVGYNDIDLCLKARAADLAVLYETRIELIHHESKTRGRADAAKVAWDDEELTDLHARWGGWMRFDPGKNPHWLSTHERPFDGLRNPGRVEVLRHIDMSAKARPWSIDQTTDPFVGNGE